MKLSPLIYHCKACNELFERAPKGVCTNCQSDDILPLTTMLQTLVERRQWLKRIHGQRVKFITIVHQVQTGAPQYPQPRGSMAIFPRAGARQVDSAHFVQQPP